MSFIRAWYDLQQKVQLLIIQPAVVWMLRLLRVIPVWSMNIKNNYRVSVRPYHLSLAVSDTEVEVLKQEPPCWQHWGLWAALTIPPISPQVFQCTHSISSRALTPHKIIVCLPKPIHMESSSYAGLMDILEFICKNKSANVLNRHYATFFWVVFLKPHWYTPTSCTTWLRKEFEAEKWLLPKGIRF